MLTLSQHTAAELQPAIGRDPDVAQMYGAAQLNAALACAALNRADDAADHLAEADQTTRAIPVDAPWFGQVYFGKANIGIWRVSLAVEQGEPGKAAEIASKVDVDAVPSAARRAMFHSDLGRGLATDKRTRSQAVTELRRAEDIAPTLVRSNVFVRETVSELLRRVRRDDAAGRELSGIAYRMRLAG